MHRTADEGTITPPELPLLEQIGKELIACQCSLSGTARAQRRVLLHYKHESLLRLSSLAV
jgi:hypothetical protein